MAEKTYSNGNFVCNEYRENNPISWEKNQVAQKYLPGGDSRSTTYYFPYPQFFVRGEGCWLYDADGHRYLDFTSNHTILVLGNNHPEVKQAQLEQIEKGACFPGPTDAQVNLARLLCERLPSVEQVRFTNSGTEATMNAIRAARAFTGKTKIIKAEGAFHGTEDVMEVSIAPDLKYAGSQQNPIPLPHVAGIPDGVIADTVIMPYNDPAGARAVMEQHRDDLAAVIVEPVMGSAGMIPASIEFLSMLRQCTWDLSALLIFDEVVTFRLSAGGAQEYYGITPDMTCLGKMVGGGMPLGAFGGRSDIMALFDPSEGSPVIHHGGSLNGNPVSLASGAATLEQLTPEVYRKLDYLGDRLRERLRDLFAEMEVPAQITGAGSLFGIHLTDHPVENYRDAKTADSDLRHKLFLSLLNDGIAMDPRGVGCFSAVMEESHIDDFIGAMRKALTRVA